MLCALLWASGGGRLDRRGVSPPSMCRGTRGRRNVGMIGGGERIVLTHGEARAEVTLLGAEIRSWRVGGAELMWSGDPAVWDGVAPVLFPVVGWTRGGIARVDGRTWPLGLHGFARSRVFSPQSVAPDEAVLVLRDDAATCGLWPFRFALRLRYRLSETALSVRIEVVNEGDRPMPYAAGLHPGFRWPLPGADGAAHAVHFDEPEEPSVPEIAPGGLFSDRRRPVPLDGRTLPLKPALFAREALCFLHARSRGLRLEAAPPGGASLRVRLEGLPHIVLWTRPDAPFLCIEGWSGWGDPEHFEGDLFQKPGMTVLAPGAMGLHGYDAQFTPGSRSIGS